MRAGSEAAEVRCIAGAASLAPHQMALSCTRSI
jgi:hypothetical protein